MSAEERARATGAEWLARMRWGALAIQTAAILVATKGLGVDLPVVPMWSLVAVGALSNLGLASRANRAGLRESIVVAVAGFDRLADAHRRVQDRVGALPENELVGLEITRGALIGRGGRSVAVRMHDRRAR